MSTAKYIRWFTEIRNEDVASVGGKNASLGEMYQDLTKVGVKIPTGLPSPPMLLAGGENGGCH